MIKPLRNLVHVRKESLERKTASGIILADKEESDQQYGTVISCGDKVKEDIKKDDRVFFPRNCGHKLEDGTILLLEEHILGIIE